MQLVLLETVAAFAVFVLFPGLPAAVLTLFSIVVGRQVGLSITRRRTFVIAAVCALVAPLPELLLGVVGPPDPSAAVIVGTWAMLLPGACAGAFSAAWFARRLDVPAERTASAGRAEQV